MLKSLINKLLPKNKLVAKLNWEHLRETGKVVGLTGIDVILDSLGYTGKQIEDLMKLNEDLSSKLNQFKLKQKIREAVHCSSRISN